LEEKTGIDMEEAAAALAGNSVFRDLGEKPRHDILAKAKTVTLTIGAVLFQRGESGDCAFVIVDGELDVLVDLGIGTVELAVLGPRQLVGEIGVFGDMPRTATVVARTPARLLRLDRADVMDILTTSAAASRAIITNLGRRLNTVNQPLAFLSVAARALKRDALDTEGLEALTAAAKNLGSFGESFDELIREVQAKQVRRHDMAIATRVQQSVLPPPWQPSSQAAKAFSLHAFMRPTRDVGGDLYDYFMIDPGHLAVVVADVSGKSVPAALFMVMFRTAVKAVATPGTDAAQILERANAILTEENDACMFVTVFFGILDCASGTLRYVNAGHNPPYLLPADGPMRTLPAHGVAIGMVDTPGYGTRETTLTPGDLLFLFTDGITEALAPDGEQYGESRLEAILEDSRAESPTAVVERVVGAVDAFAGKREQSDDITCLALLFRPPIG
jgi:serine phosphatase RsbU (regulator of sigma subunit)